jgi:hypothetical protein
MTDDRLRLWLAAAEQPLAPDPSFAVALRDELRVELGLSPRASIRPIGGRRLQTRDRARLGRSELLLVAALVLVALVALAVVAGSLLDRSAALTPGEVELAARVPSTIRASCARATRTQAPDSTFSIWCPLSGAGADEVTYSYFDQPPVMLGRYDEYVQREAIPAGDCRTGEKASGPWSLGQTFHGHLLCFPEADGRAWIAWTYEEGGQGSGILVVASRRDGNSIALYEWWTRTAYYLIH